MTALLFVLFSQSFSTGFDYNEYRINLRNAWIINSLITKGMRPEIVNAFNYIEFRKQLVKDGILPPLPFLDEDYYWWLTEEDYTDFVLNRENKLGPDPLAAPGFGLYDSTNDMFKLRLALESLDESMRHYKDRHESEEYGIDSAHKYLYDLASFGLNSLNNQYYSEGLDPFKHGFTRIMY